LTKPVLALATHKPAIPVRGTHHLVTQALRALLYRDPGRQGAGDICRGCVCLANAAV